MSDFRRRVLWYFVLAVGVQRPSLSFPEALVAGLGGRATLLAKLGTMPLSRLLQPAAQYADEG